jgi:hypothetical protein
MPIMNAVMYLNVLLPMFAALFFLIFPRPLSAATTRPAAPA